MHTSTKLLRASLQSNWVIIPLTVLSLTGASMLLLERLEREGSNNFNVPLASLILARVSEADTNTDTEGEPIKNGTPDSTDSTAFFFSVKSGGTPTGGDTGSSGEGTPEADRGTGARPQE